MKRVIFLALGFIFFAFPVFAAQVPCVNPPNASGCSNGTITVGTGSGTVTSVDVSGGSTGLTTSGGPVTTSGTVTVAGTLNVGHGGTGLTSTPSNGQIDIGNGSGFTRTTISPGTNTTVTSGSGSVAVNVASGTNATKGAIQGDTTTLTCTSGTCSVTNPVGAPTIFGGYTYIALPNGYYYMFGGLNSSGGTGYATVVFPHSLSTGIISSGATTGQVGTSVTGPAACNSGPITACTWTVTDFSSTPVGSVPVYWWVIGY